MDKIKAQYVNFKEWWTAPRLTVTTYLKSFVDGWFIGSGVAAWFWIIVFWLFGLITKSKLDFVKK